MPTLANGAATTIIAPATNVAGLVIRHLVLKPTGSQVTLYVGTAPPAALSDGTKRMIAAWDNTLANPEPWILPLPLEIAAGLGLYGWSTAAGNNLCFGYDLK